MFATAATAGAVVAVASLLPEQLRWITLVVAFAAGSGLERFRQSRFPAPPTLRETPEAWRYVLRYDLGYRQLALALTLLAGAVAILFVPFGSDEGGKPAAAGEAPSAGPSPAVGVRREAIGERFRAAGVEFEVAEGTATGAGLDQLAGPGERLLALTVEIRNGDRASFNPAILDYRLSGPGDGLLAPARSTASGSDRLVTLGRLPRGDRVDQRLLFAVPRGARGLALEFEPLPNAAKVIRVPVT